MGAGPEIIKHHISPRTYPKIPSIAIATQKRIRFPATQVMKWRKRLTFFFDYHGSLMSQAGGRAEQSRPDPTRKRRPFKGKSWVEIYPANNDEQAGGRPDK